MTSSSGAAEPNLTPLLDMVLQLVMFFMLCANFVMEQVNESIKLPTAIAAKALDKTTADYLILNVDERGVVTVGGETLDNAVKVQGYLADRAALDKGRAKPADWEAGKGRSLVILRAHKDCPFKAVHDVMAGCRRAGYADVRLRALKGDPGQ
jgi:biopolymer transport protein ExbD